ncbi:MAG: SusD/RagB family nutrient-binding outer membrane lipoprotein [Bacteroidales bacterium]|nr:SusD/RagB family nutrient-binding outer membrane lipoprotein [Bacteroidales bacterium]
MKKIIYILIALIAVSCSKDPLTDLNKDVKSPTEIPGNTLFSNAEKNLSDQIVSLNVNHNDFDLWSQYLTETTYTDESNYEIFSRNVPDNAWRTFYRDVLQDLDRANELLSAETFAAPEAIAAKANRLAIIDIVAVYTWNRMVTLWGDIPYTEALDITNVLPVYDDGLTVHKDLLTRISADISALDVANGSFGDADLIYGGNVALWKAFANGLKVKMAVQLADISSESALVSSSIEAAKSGTFASSDDDAIFHYLGGTPNTNPLYVDLTLSGRLDFVAANTLIDKMSSLNDPRLPLYFEQNLGDDTYLGGDYGESSAFGLYSHINVAISQDPTFGNALMSYSEVQFYLAEAAARGITGDDAADLYDNAVKASIESWGGTSADAAAYLAQADVAYDAAAWKEKIGTQAWISFYLRGYEGWSTWRRLDAPAMNMPPTPADGGFPYRYTYPSGEQTLNGTNYTAAASAIGGDKLGTKLYWDKF